MTTSPTPAEAWAARRPLGGGEREAFAAEVRRCQGEARRAQGYPEGAALGRTAQAAVDREAILACDLLRLL